jgi:hypothetical protein
MAAPRAYVTFEFQLPLVLMLRAQPGPWPRAPRGAELGVGRDGRVSVLSYDRSEVYARNQVLKVAAAFLRSVDDRIGAHLLIGTLYPSNGDRAARYSIALGARVSITPTFTQAELIEPDLVA